MMCEDKTRKVREIFRLREKQEYEEANRRQYKNYSNGTCNVIRHGHRENWSLLNHKNLHRLLVAYCTVFIGSLLSAFRKKRLPHYFSLKCW